MLGDEANGRLKESVFNQEESDVSEMTLLIKIA
jgi:hypothetical protein